MGRSPVSRGVTSKGMPSAGARRRRGSTMGTRPTVAVTVWRLMGGENTPMSNVPGGVHRPGPTFDHRASARAISPQVRAAGSSRPGAIWRPHPRSSYGIWPSVRDGHGAMGRASSTWTVG